MSPFFPHEPKSGPSRRIRLGGLVRVAVLGGTLASLAWSLKAAPDTAVEPSARRQAELVRIVRQDCGSCHGMRLTGGLGPALSRETLSEWPIESLVSVIYFGRPGTPMPGWRTMIDERDALWIARRLQSGFPEETPGGSR